MPSGRSIRDSIHSTLVNEARAQQAWQQEANEANKRMSSARRQIDERFQSLSRAYLADKDSEAIRVALGPALAKADVALQTRQRIYEEFQQELPKVEQSLSDLNKRCDSLQASRDDMLAQVNAADTVARSTEGFQRALQQRETMAAILAANKERAISLKELSKTKLTSYRANSVFRYLAERKYGSPFYSANPLVARMDAMAAKSVNFSINFDRYQALLAIPEHVDRDVSERERQLEDFEKGPLAEAEKESREQNGYFPLKESLDRIQSQLNEQLGEREKSQNRLLEIQQHLAAIVGGMDENFKQALSLVENFLSEIPESDLQQIASQTPDSSDDAQVAQIMTLRASLTSDIQLTQSLSEKIAEAGRRVKNLQNLEQEFRRRDYDDTYANFPGLDITPILTGYLLGKISHDTLLSKVQHHYVDDTPAVSTSTWSSSSWGDSSSIGSSGGFSSGGGFGGGGGGFSSGNGF